MDRISTAIFLALLPALFGGAAYPAVTTLPQNDPAWAHVPKHAPTTDHGTYFRDAFSDGPSVTRACLKCHENAATEVMRTAHWNLVGEEVLVPGHDEPMRIGKRNLINNFCIGISSNWPGCTTCHIGYGWDNKDFDLTNPSLVDCLVCHDTTGTYKKKKGGAGHPDPAVDLLTVARSVGLPMRVNCGSCHFQGGGGNAIKHGDLDDTLLFPGVRIDVHMGKLDFSCIDCHQAKEHLLPGRLLTISVDRKNRLRCTDCHAQQPHADLRLNAHTQRVACQTCHIPYMAVDSGTKLSWDWSQAGQDLAITDAHLYLKIKGRFTYAKGVPPEYYWYNETSSRYILGDIIDPKVATKIAAPLGGRDDPESKIYPFKVHRGKQIYDAENKYFILPHVHGDKGFWSKFDWPSAAQIGADTTGLAYSGVYGFAPTEMFLPQNHMVTPAAKALQCRDCHGSDGRLDWLALGYKSDPLGRPVLEHAEFMLLDANEVPVQESGEPMSTRTSCGQCHDVFDENFNASHGYHSNIDLASLPEERRILLRHGPGVPTSDQDEMNCFLCHMEKPNHAERLRALTSDEQRWSVSATLIGSGLLERYIEGYTWNQVALEEIVVEPGTRHVRPASCAPCHGAIREDDAPLHVDIGSGTEWTTEKTGQIFSAQRISLSGMNLKNKDQLARAWDVHAERLVQCGDCHYSRGRPARLAGNPAIPASAQTGEKRRRCESCHGLSDTHNWLPEKDRHMKAVSCESCHVPKLYMAAQQLLDRTVVRLDHKPQVFYRGVEKGRIENPTTAYIESYKPLVLIGESVDGGDKLIPYNLVAEWFWVDAETNVRVPQDALRTAWTTDNKYRKDVLQTLDSNQDGQLSDAELRLDSIAGLQLIQRNLQHSGVSRPEIRGQIRSYHIHHNVTHGDLVNRDCSGCHEPAQDDQDAFELSPYLPGNVPPQEVVGEGLVLDGHWQQTDDGRLLFVRDQPLADGYRKRQQKKQQEGEKNR